MVGDSALHERHGTVKIFGERNTGTNALKQLIECNSRSVCLPGADGEVNLLLARLAVIKANPPRLAELINDLIYVGRSPLNAWKHCATNFSTTDIFHGRLVLFTIRHPASWLLSLFKNPYHRIGPPAGDLATFINTPWRTVRRERLNRESYYPLDLYETKLRSYRDYSAKLAAAGVANRFIRHEDIVLDQEGVFRQVADHLMFPREDVAPIRSATKQSPRTLDEIKSYYAEEKWRVPFRGMESHVNQRIDWSELKAFGYSPLE